MKIIKKRIKLNDSIITILSSKLYNNYFKGNKIAFFDIETTGLSPKYNNIILTGFVIIDTVNLSGELIQYFAENTLEEKNILLETIETLKNVDYVVTYNGKSFDMPFLYERCKNEAISYERLYNLDLYQLVKNHSTLKNTLGSLSQKSIEKFMGISDNREDEISGGKSVMLYSEYTHSLNDNLLNKILLHNADDVMQLSKLIPLIKYFDMDIAVQNLGFPLKNFFVTNFSYKSTTFRIEGIQRKNPKDYISFPTIDFPERLEFMKKEMTWFSEYPVYTRNQGRFLDLSCLDVSGKLGTKIQNIPEYIDGKLIIEENGKQNYMAQFYFAKLLAEYIEDRLK